MKEYYSRRASEYERIYNRDDPPRQKELDIIRQKVRTVFEGKRLLDLACGTGYWAEYAAKSAKAILGIDFSAEAIDIARSKQYGCPADFVVGDMYNLPVRERSFDAVMAGFLFSHVPKDRIAKFLDEMARVAAPGAYVLLFDNILMDGCGGELIVPADDENTYKLRRLSDGTEYRVLKNYYRKPQLNGILRKHLAPSISVSTDFMTYYWVAELT